MKIKAGSLSYALFLALIISLLCFLMIGLLHLNRIAFLRSDLSFRVEDALYTGISESRALFKGSRIITNYQDETFKLTQMHRNWGAFEMASCLVEAKDRRLGRAVILAHEAIDSIRALYHPDENNSLGMSGEAQIIGDAYLSSKGLETKFINGKGILSSKMLQGNKREAGKSLPQLPFDYVKYWRAYLEGQINSVDSLSKNAFSETIRHPFWKKTIVYSTSNSLKLQGVKWKGNIIVVSNEEIEISADCDLKDLILIAPVIKVNSGARISAHLFAVNSIEIGDSVHLNYPSSISLINRKGEAGQIELKPNSRVNGAIVHTVDLRSRSNDVHLWIQSKALVIGTVYNSGNMQLQGTVLGQVFSRYFLVKTETAIYEDVILDGQINRKDHPGPLLFLPINAKSKQRIAKFL
ncbi:MAG: hypothetical protein NXI09_15710 [Bacteroidetes bacterium]|nr:hypothetical protein [Bacteroidota bacterium]